MLPIPSVEQIAYFMTHGNDDDLKVPAVEEHIRQFEARHQQRKKEQEESWQRLLDSKGDDF